MAASKKPLIVLMALVQRGDSLPADDVRRSRVRYNVNASGEGIEDPGVTDRVLAMTGVPQLEWEAFDEYWRKVHGPKILFEEGPEGKDKITQLLKYYLQQHRLPGGPTSSYAPPYLAKTGTDGHLVPDPSAQVAEYQRPPFDGVAQLAFHTKDDVKAFFDIGPGKYSDKIVPDEAVFIRGFAFHLAEEHIVVNIGDGRRDPIILLKLHTRKPEISRAAFLQRWGGSHAERVQLLQTNGVIKRYAQFHNVGRREDGLFDEVGNCYDGSAAWSFANMNELEAFLASDAQAEIAQDEFEFCAETSYFTAINYVICDNT